MKNSLNKRAVQDVHKTWPSLVTRFFVFKTKTNDSANPRIGFAFSRRHANAVWRNRFKRRLREMIRLNLKTGVDVLCLAKAPLTNITEPLWETESRRIKNWFETLERNHSSSD